MLSESLDKPDVFDLYIVEALEQGWIVRLGATLHSFGMQKHRAFGPENRGLSEIRLSAPLTLGTKVRIEGNVVFARGSGARRGEAKEWAAAEDAKGHAYACGCGGRIRVTAGQFKTGVPRWLRGHHSTIATRMESEAR